MQLLERLVRLSLNFNAFLLQLMKHNTLLLLIAMGSSTLFAQEKIQTTNSSDSSPTQVKSHTKESATAKPVAVSNTSETNEEVNYPITVSYSRDQKKQSDTPRTIEDIDTDIKNIKEKTDYVKNSPEMDEKARKEGWYARNEELLKKLETEKSILLNK